MPTTPVQTYSNQKLEPTVRPDLAVTIAIALVPADSNTTVHYARGTLLGRNAETGLYGIYESSNDDGTGVAVGLLVYDVTVDDAGQMSLTTGTSAVGEFGIQRQNIALYVSGYFRAADLLQSGPGSIDSNALTDLGGRFLNGDLTNGIFRF